MIYLNNWLVIENFAGKLSANETVYLIKICPGDKT